MEPLVEKMSEEGIDRPRLRAEIAIAALLGVSLSRSLGWFEEVHLASREEVGELIEHALDSITQPDLALQVRHGQRTTRPVAP